jgi:hypothetical protein
MEFGDICGTRGCVGPVKFQATTAQTNHDFRLPYLIERAEQLPEAMGDSTTNKVEGACVCK